MAHSLHAYPLPDEQYGSSMAPAGPSYASCTITSSASASPPQNQGPSQQTRRLQLRNNGFRGAVLPFRRISPLLGASAPGIEPFTRSISAESSPSSAEKRSLYGEDIPHNPVNILQELHNISAGRKRSSPRPGFGAIFEDPVEREGTEHGSPTSWYNEGSTSCSPLPSAMTPPRTWHLREVSSNYQNTPSPLSSPLIKHPKGRKSNSMKNRSASAEVAQYIEHLESELASAQAKLDLQPSPKTSKLRAAKMRALTTENRNLKHEIFEWEKKFDSRVQEERDKRLEADMELRSRMRMLEDEVEMKDTRMREIEWEMESMRTKIREIEGLEEVNLGLEKRIEALTNLLVHSPTKLEVTSASTSPVRMDPSRRTPRPKSMLPRVPTSPGGLRFSLPTVSESASGRPQSLASSSNVLESPEEEPEQDLGNAETQSPTYNMDMTSPLHKTQSGPWDRSSRTSMSHRSAPSSASKRTSLRSSCSLGPVSWVLPEDDGRSASKQRKMRRFPSGSNSLKPLILPSAKAGPPVPVSAPIYPSIESTSRRDISDVSIDPTSAFLSSLADSSRTSTPEQIGHRRSTTWAQEQALKALEGGHRRTGHSGSDRTQEPRPQFQKHPFEEDQFMGFREIPSDKPQSLSRPRSLQKELEEAEIQQDGISEIQHSDYNVYEDGLVLLNGQYESLHLSPDITATAPRVSQQAHTRQQRLHIDTDITPKPPLKHFPPSIAPPLCLKADPSTTLTHEHAQGLFSRLTSVISETKQGPCILARRLLANAWSVGSKRLGGIGWWLLGLVYGARGRRRKQADVEIAEDDYRNPSIEPSTWQRYSEQAARSRSREPFLRESGGGNRNRDSWLQPPHVSHRRVESRRIAPQTTPEGRDPHLFPCDECVEPTCRRTFRLWLRFSLAIVLAVGLAVKNGPANLLESEEPPHFKQHHEREPLLRHQRQNRQARACQCGGDECSQGSRTSHDTIGVDSGYGSITFAETLGPRDFEGSY